MCCACPGNKPVCQFRQIWLWTGTVKVCFSYQIYNSIRTQLVGVCWTCHMTFNQPSRMAVHHANGYVYNHASTWGPHVAKFFTKVAQDLKRDCTEEVVLYVEQHCSWLPRPPQEIDELDIKMIQLFKIQQGTFTKGIVYQHRPPWQEAELLHWRIIAGLLTRMYILMNFKFIL